VSIRTAANLTMERLDVGWTVTSIHLEVIARIPAGDVAKAGCPISRLLNTKITMDARLEG